MKVKFSEKDIESNRRRTADNGLISYLSLKEFNDLINKYFRDSEGDLHCAYSDEVITSRGKNGTLRLEHMIPVSMGGGTILIFLLTFIMGVEQRVAQATNLIFFIPTSGIITSFGVSIINSTNLATSFVSNPFSIFFLIFILLNISVFNIPGKILVTLIPYFATSSCSDLVKPTPPPL